MQAATKGNYAAIPTHIKSYMKYLFMAEIKFQAHQPIDNQYSWWKLKDKLFVLIIFVQVW